MTTSTRRAWARSVAVALVTTVCVLLTVGTPVAADADVRVPPSEPESTELLTRFAPVLAVRRQATPCGAGEPYRPMAVDHVLERDDVVLRDGDGALVTTAPTPDQLAAGPSTWTIDLPGDALAPGCHYEQWARAMAAEPTVYGRVVVADDVLVAQYWMYYVYNDWNDRHESDWEMVQLLFDATSVEAAMRQGPFLYAYAQHEGVEYTHTSSDGATLPGVSGTGSDKLTLVGESPVVYPGEGSHAAYFSSARWFGRSSSSGFGCDDTTAPLELVHPDVVVLPTDAPRSGPFAWLSFEGRWGERRPAFNDGPTGPATKRQWDDPVGWVTDDGRDAAIRIPFGGDSTTDAFCSATRSLSVLVIDALDAPWRSSALGVTALTLAAVFIGYASQGLLTRARRVYRRDVWRFLAVGVIVPLGEAVAFAARLWVRSAADADGRPDLAGPDSPWRVPVMTALTFAILLPAMAWSMAAALELVAGRGRIARGERWWLPRVRGSSFLTTLALLSCCAFALTLLFPLAAVLAAWFFVVPVVCASAGVDIPFGMRHSAVALRRHRLRSVALMVLCTGMVTATALAGAAVLLLTSAGFHAASAATALTGLVVVPYVAIVVALFERDLREPVPPDPAGRRRRPEISPARGVRAWW